MYLRQQGKKILFCIKTVIMIIIKKYNYLKKVISGRKSNEYKRKHLCGIG